MSQFFTVVTAGNLPPTVVETVTGNDGVPEAAIANNFNFLTANATVKFIGSPATETLDFGLSNLILGSSATSITSASLNVGVGFQSLNSLTSGTTNTALGYQSLDSLTTGSSNTAIGWECLGDLTTGTLNTVLGSSTMSNLLTGSRNIAIGSGTGDNYTSSEGSNILIGNPGTLGESNKIRIGINGSLPGQQNATFIAGITGVTVAGAPVSVSSTGQLASLGFGIANQVLTSNGAGNSPTWKAVSGSALVNVTAPGAYPYTTLATDNVIIVDTSAARTIIPMAAPATGQTYRIKDNVGSAAANNITITPSGNNIDGAASYVINNNYGSVDIVYNGTQWNKF